MPTVLAYNIYLFTAQHLISGREGYNTTATNASFQILSKPLFSITNPERQAVRVTKFCTVAPIICGVLIIKFAPCRPSNR
jgi:hypothetical protein